MTKVELVFCCEQAPWAKLEKTAFVTVILAATAMASSTAAPPPAVTFYRRPLPSLCVAFASEDGRARFASALSRGGCEAYFSLAEHFSTQSKPTFCGLGTLSMILNALALDPGRVYIGPWRWYHEEMLDCCKSLDLVEKDGITFDEFCCLARCNGAEVLAQRAPGNEEQGEAQAQSEESFRADVVKSCCTPSNASGGVEAAPARSFLVCSYDRRVLGQTGSGHFSPIGAYDEASDSILVMDVARFKYPPHWIPLPLMFSAMRSLDSDCGLPRGWALVSRKIKQRSLLSSLLFDVPRPRPAPSPSSADAWRLFALWLRSLPTPDSTQAAAPPSLSLTDTLKAVDSVGGIRALLCGQQRPTAVPAREEEAKAILEVEGLGSFAEAKALGLSALFDPTASDTATKCCAPRTEDMPSKKPKLGACCGASAASGGTEGDDDQAITVRSLMVGPAHALAVLHHACLQEVCVSSSPALLPARAQTEADAMRMKLAALSQPTTPPPK